MLFRAGLVVALAGVALVGGALGGTVRAAGPAAMAVLHDAAGTELGTVQFRQSGGVVIVSANVRGLAPGFHGLHIHANSDPANGAGCLADPNQPSNTWFLAVDGHFKLGSEFHDDHQGDLPILLVNGTGAADARAVAMFRTDRFAVSDILGRAVIVHALADNFANVPVGPNTDQYTANSQAAIDKTTATGNAGDRLLCGVIDAA